MDDLLGSPRVASLVLLIKKKNLLKKRKKGKLECNHNMIDYAIATSA
jgi:hypothetical protein